MEENIPAAQTPRGARAPRVAIIDADRRVRQSISDLLTLAGVPVVGSAGEIGKALELVERAQPTILLVDPRLPDVDAGEALLTALAIHSPSVRVILMGWSDALERPSLLARASAYLLKGSEPEEFVTRTLAACGC